MNQLTEELKNLHDDIEKDIVEYFIYITRSGMTAEMLAFFTLVNAHLNTLGKLIDNLPQ